MTALPHVEILTRRDCCLCDEAKAVVAAAAASGLCTWGVVDVDADPRLVRRYGLDVPVVRVNGEVRFKHRVPASALTRILREAAAC